MTNVNAQITPAQNFNLFDAKVDFPKNLTKPSKIKIVSDSLIEYKAGEDTTAKIIALKAPVIKIQSLLSASNKLVIFTDLLILDGGYITEPKDWDIKAKDVHLIHVNKKSQWITTLIKNDAIESSTFNSIEKPATNFDIPASPNLEDRLKEIGNEIKEFKDRYLNWR